MPAAAMRAKITVDRVMGLSRDFRYGRMYSTQVSAVTGIAAPRDTPAEIVARLNAEINAAYADPAMKARFAETGGEVLTGSPSEFGKLFGGEIAKWAGLLRLSGVKTE